MSVKEVMTNLADAARARYSVSDKLTVADITDLIQGENADVAKLIDRSITKIEIPEGVTEIGKEAFRGCSQLTEVTLPSTITSIGENAFADCGALSQVTCGFYEVRVPGYPWGADVDVTSFIFTEDMTPLVLTAEEAGSTVKLTAIGSPTISGLRYRTNENDVFAPYTIDTMITLNNVGDSVQFYNTENSLSRKANNYVQFVMTGKIAASGTIQSMLNSSTDCVEGCYIKMFSDCTSLTQAPELPATTLAEYCYSGMFSGCASLSQAPELPATMLAGDCYSSMFDACVALAQAPELPATMLARYCYSNMFHNCTSLTQAPALPATTLADVCYVSMFSGCTSLTQAPELPATRLTDRCYENMFRKCDSLTRAPELPATTLADDCYSGMFYNCESLAQAPELPATRLTDRCYENMFYSCTSLSQAPELPATTLAEACYFSMFSGCTSLTQAPELPATTLVGDCYEEMFRSCMKLSYINVGFTAWHDTATTNWVVGVPHYDGTFTCPSTLSKEFGMSRIPPGWTVDNK